MRKFRLAGAASAMQQQQQPLFTMCTVSVAYTRIFAINTIVSKVGRLTLTVQLTLAILVGASSSV